MTALYKDPQGNKVFKKLKGSIPINITIRRKSRMLNKSGTKSADKDKAGTEGGIAYN